MIATTATIPVFFEVPQEALWPAASMRPDLPSDRSQFHVPGRALPAMPHSQLPTQRFPVGSIGSAALIHSEPSGVPIWNALESSEASME